MTTSKFSILILCTLIVFCDSAFVNSLKKCNIDDAECMRELYKSVLTSISSTGIPELGIPPTDPLRLENVTISTLNLINLTLVDGAVKGLKDCVFNSFSIDIEKYYASLNVTCDMAIKGHYRASSTNPLLTNLFGGSSIKGDGRAKVELNKLNIHFDFYLTVEKRDGEIYLKCKTHDIHYKYEILDKVSFTIDGFFLAKQDASKFAEDMLNKNWRFVFIIVGNVFMDKAMEYMYQYAHEGFFAAVPARYYIIDDLTNYVKTK